MDTVLCCSMQKWPISKAGSNELTVKAFTAITSNTNHTILHFPAVLFLELLVAPQSYYLRRRSRSFIRNWMPTKQLDGYLSGLMRLVCVQDIWLTFTMSGFQWAVGGNVKLKADSRLSSGSTEWNEGLLLPWVNVWLALFVKHCGQYLG